MNAAAMLKTIGVEDYILLMAKCAALAMEQPDVRDPIFNQTYEESYTILRDFAVSIHLADLQTPTFTELVKLIQEEDIE